MNYKEKFKNLPRTPWFLGSVKPAYVGVYERLFTATQQTVFQYWDGNFWHCGPNFTGLYSSLQNAHWRGCTERFTSYSVFDTTKT